MAGEGLLSYLESDGKSVNFIATAAVVKGQVAAAGATKYWLGVVNKSAAIGEPTNMNVDGREYQFTVPVGLGAKFGDVIYVDMAQLTGHTPNVGAYALTSGGAKQALCKCTMDQSGQTVTGILMQPFN